MLDSDFAGRYSGPTSCLNEQLKRPIHRFPDAVAFGHNPEDCDSLMSQVAISNTGKGGN
jgi:hypothetical protein